VLDATDPLLTPTDRRRVLRLAAAGAAGLWLPRSAWSQPALRSDPFALGVASGSPTHDSVVLWTRLIGAEAMLPPSVTVRWELAHDEGFTRIVQSGQAQAVAELAHSVHVEVPNLEPDRWYHYRFMAGGALSPTGRTRSFPRPEARAARLRLAYASCQRWEHGYFSAYRHMLDEELDAVLFLGDYIYEYTAARNAVRVPPDGPVLTLDGYRRRHALHKSEPELQAMHARCPWLFVWDDHEVENDYAGTHEGRHVLIGPDFAARRAAAYQAYYEHMPLRAGVLEQALAGLARGAPLRLHGQLRFGRLATMVLLDLRQYKDAPACTRGGRPGASHVDPAQCGTWNDPQRSMLGAAQERWLDGALANAGEQWNLIAQTTLFGRRNDARAPAQSFWNDGWDGYPAARTRLCGALRRHRVGNAVVLGGDVHENWVGHVKADYDVPGSPAIGVEFCGTSISSRSSGADRLAQRLAENPHFVFADAARRGYGVLDLDDRRLRTTLRVVDDPTRRDTQIATLARFEVPAGRAVIERDA
jgi:alkaline phosphatase D